jgi:Uncharacterised protein family (UPF0175)
VDRGDAPDAVRHAGKELGYNRSDRERFSKAKGGSITINFTFSLPPEVEERLRAELPDLSGAVREAFAVDLFRRGILTHHGLGQSLGLDRFETDALLNRHRVTDRSLTHEDVDADVRSLDELLAMPRP